MDRFNRFAFRGACFLFMASASSYGATPMPDILDRCLYLPPAFSDRVVFYDGFESRAGGPEIDRIHAQVTGTTSFVPDGFAGNGCRSSQPNRDERPLQIRSPSIDMSRPMTFMRTWRVNAPMQETSSFQLLALLGKGHISCFIRGKGEWCALQRPTMFVQIDGVPHIANINQPVLDNAYFQPGEWHHIAVTVANASDVRFYLDGRPLVALQAQGRAFAADDLNSFEPFSDGGNFAEHPTTTDDLIIVDRALSGEEIEQFWRSARQLRQMNFPPLLPPLLPDAPAGAGSGAKSN